MCPDDPRDSKAPPTEIIPGFLYLGMVVYFVVLIGKEMNTTVNAWNSSSR